MRHLLSTAVLIVVTFLKTYGCVNENRALLNGRIKVSDMPSLVPYGYNFKDDISYYQRELKELDSLWRRNKRIEDYSDYGVILIYMGRYEEAKDVFIDIEKNRPGLYTTAANLGTAYELLGENQLALKWIKKAVEINPGAHDNSEWLHVKILEAKIKGGEFVSSEFLISTDFGSDEIPQTTLDSLRLIELRDAIYYQLNERVSFVKPLDKIVALLLFELGNISAITDDVTSALRIYDRAKEYGFSSPVLDKRYARFVEMQAGLDNEYTAKQLMPSKSESNKGFDYSLLVLAALIILAGYSIVFFLIKR